MLGKLLAGRYQIIEHLGEGGFGQTYLATDNQLPGKPHCVVKRLKTLSPHILPTARRLFEREAGCLQSLGKHGQIPQLFAYFEEDEEFYLVEEYVQGKSLSEEFKTQRKWTELEVIGLLKEILSILELVHQEHVIHRDIKPSNIIRRIQDNKLVLIDFGSVKQVSRTNTNSPPNQRHTVAISTSGYTPTEQLQGQPRFGSDIYALGMTAIQALTGIKPRELEWDVQTGEVKWRHLVAVSDQLAEIVDRMVKHHIKDRYQLVGEVMQDLDAFFHLSQQSTNMVGESTVSTPVVTEIQSQLAPSNQIHPPETTRRPVVTWFKLWHLLLLLTVGGIFGVKVIYPTMQSMHYVRQGGEFLDLLKPDEALRSFGSAIKIQRNNATAWKGRGNALRLLERHEAALAAYERAIRLKSADSDAWMKKGWVLYEQGRYEQALEAQEKAIEIQGNNANAWGGKGIALVGLSRYEDALTAFEMAKKLEPESPKVWQNEALVLEYLQRPAQAVKIYEEALASYNDALNNHPRDLIAWIDRGEVLGKLQRLEEAIYSYDQAIEVNPNFHLPWQNKGNAYCFLGKHDQALESYDRALELMPRSYLTWHSRGSCLAQGKKAFAEAIKSFDRSIAIKASFHHAWRDRGLALMSLNKYQQAIASFDKALTVEPDDHQSWLSRGLALIELGRNSEALLAFDQAVKIAPQDPFVWANRGFVFERLGRRQDAIESYEQAVKINPRFPPAIQALERLR